MNKKRCSLLISFLFASQIFASDSSSYFLVYFKDKKESKFNISNPELFLSQKAIQRRINRRIKIEESDLPVNSTYIHLISTIKGIEVLQSTKWLNGIVIKTQSSNFDFRPLYEHAFVDKITFLAKTKNKTKPNIHVPENNISPIKKDSFSSDKDYWGKAYFQNQLIGSNSRFYNGKGITIAVFDAGFYMAYQTKGMQSLLSNYTISKDFVDNDNSVWEDDKHGANCLSLMMTNAPGYYVGTAPEAHYVLMRTEDADNENLKEEVNWLLAAEFCDSLGVDLISSSLGYHTFDHSETNHTYNDLDGKTTIIAKAAQFAYAKGIVVINSAGNEGNSKWRKIGTPADAKDVITIGATDHDGKYCNFSSKGLTADSRIKPDFVCLGQRAIVASPNGTYAGNGTSYATPIFAGAFACMLQAFPLYSIDTFKNVLKYSATHYHTPDSLYGYGIPNFDLAYKLLGYFKDPTDTLSDYIYIKKDPVYFQELPLFFRSKTNQIITIEVNYLSKKRVKKMKTSTHAISANQWFRDDNIIKFINSKKKKKFNQIEIVLKSNTLTYQKTFYTHYH
jgi:serine protease AprX